MPEPTRLLLWTDTPGPYLERDRRRRPRRPRARRGAAAQGASPSAEQLRRHRGAAGWGVPAGLLPRMPKLRWAQAMTAGVEGWLALPDLPPGLTLTCARGTHARIDAGEHHRRAVLRRQALRRRRREPEAAASGCARVAQPLTGKTLGILGLGAIGQEVARIAAALGMRVIGTSGAPAPMPGVAEVLPPERTDEVLAQSDFVLLLLPATPETENFIDAGAAGEDEAGRLAAEFRPRPR